jgi:hypothetical protein
MLGPAVRAQVAPLSAAESAAWQQHLMPLPKEIALSGKVTMPLSQMHLELPSPATELDQCLADEFAAVFREKASAELDTSKAAPRVSLRFARTPAAKQALSGKRNGDQGYLITAAEENGRVTITCDALTDVGCYYAMKTLKQLFLPTLKSQGAAATVDVLLGRIVDWPDMEERGQWGGTCVQDLEWLSDMKFNLIELHATLTVDDQGASHAEVNAEVMERARRHGVHIVPIIHHLEQLPNTGMFKAYPQLRAVDAPSDNPQVQNVCFSRPEVAKVVGGWMAALGQIPDVREVMVWLSEEGKGCQCDPCKQMDRFTSEVKALTAAWNEAKQACPKLGLRVLLTQFSYASNDKVLAALPTGAKVSYYHGGLTYNTERKPMIYPLLEDYVKQGKWMGVYPTFSSNWLTVAPFTNPEFTHYRLTEFVDKGLQNLVGYVVPTHWYYQVNNAAALEWSWNAHGRGIRQFTTSWAVRNALKDPAQFVKWTDLIGPPAWDLYASNYPYLENWGQPSAKVAAGTMQLGLGTSFFAEFKTPEKFAANTARLQDALKAAQDLGELQFITESEIVLAYTQVLQSLWQLSQICRGDEGPLPESRSAAVKWFTQCQTALDLIVDRYPKWSLACQSALAGNAPDRFSQTVQMMEQLAARLSDLMEKYGFTDENRPYRVHQVGSWKSEEFAQQKGQARRIDVTSLVGSAGTYWFRPAYRSGAYGLSVTAVALVSYFKANPDDVRQEAVDTHSCHAGAWVKDDIYTLGLKAFDPNRGYAVIAQINGSDSTQGMFLFKKLRE